MFRFTIRDVLWLTVVVGLVLGWLIDHLAMKTAVGRMESAAHRVAEDWANEVGHPVKYQMPDGYTWNTTPGLIH